MLDGALRVLPHVSCNFSEGIGAFGGLLDISWAYEVEFSEIGFDFRVDSEVDWPILPGAREASRAVTVNTVSGEAIACPAWLGNLEASSGVFGGLWERSRSTSVEFSLIRADLRSRSDG